MSDKIAARDDPRYLDVCIMPVDAWRDAVDYARELAAHARRRHRVERDGPWWIVYVDRGAA